MATKKTVEKLYVLLDSDGDLIDMDTLDELKGIMEMHHRDGEDTSGYSVCEVGPKKKITFVPSTVKIG